jgi:tripartite-type tricarboxylate transporter receptor subunit TctC
VASEKRLPDYPQIPTYAESGFPLIASTWVGVFAPRGVSDGVVNKLNDAINSVLNDPGAQSQFKTLQTQLRQGDAVDAAAFFQRDVAQWKTMITSIGLINN